MKIDSSYTPSRPGVFRSSGLSRFLTCNATCKAPSCRPDRPRKCTWSSAYRTADDRSCPWQYCSCCRHVQRLSCFGACRTVEISLHKRKRYRQGQETASNGPRAHGGVSRVGDTDQCAGDRAMGRSTCAGCLCDLAVLRRNGPARAVGAEHFRRCGCKREKGGSFRSRPLQSLNRPGAVRPEPRRWASPRSPYRPCRPCRRRAWPERTPSWARRRRRLRW